MPNALEAQIKNRISEFVRELDLLVRKTTFNTLKGALAGGAAQARRGPGRPAGGGRGSTLVEGVAEAILAHVRANDAHNVGEIAKAVGAAPKAAKKAIIALLASGQIKKTGQKRGTRYHMGSGKAHKVAKAKKAGKRGKRRERKAKKGRRVQASAHILHR